MHLTQIRLHNFRCYQQLTLLPPRGITMLVGDNGAGKTNLLEAIHLCCLGRSHRTSDDQDMIRQGEETCAVHAKVQRGGGIDEVGVRLYPQQKRRKLIFVNGKTVGRIGELMGHMTCVMFSPEDINVIKDGPQGRRRFLDMLLSQCLPAYFYALQHYNLVLKQRNALLRAVARQGADPQQLPDWDEQLALACVPLVRARRDAVQRLSDLAGRHYAYISGKEGETLLLTYHSSLKDSADLKADLLGALRRGQEDDIRRQMTCHGPHRDDILVQLRGRELQAFGSQGQIRSAMLAMRLAEIDILTKAQGEAPLLLLDDVLSELDQGRRSRLMMGLQDVQTFITCTDLADVEQIRPACVLQVKDGQISQMETQ
ncbi:MAG: DNA replication/repair protein RecF [Christensenellales bacterium]